MNAREDVVMTRRERDIVLNNKRGLRPGIYGTSLDDASGRELDRVCRVFGIERQRARLFGWRMPWGERDELLRHRTFLHYQVAREHQTNPLPRHCKHNVWGVYAGKDGQDYVKCEDCDHLLCWCSPSLAARIRRELYQVSEAPSAAGDSRQSAE